MALTFEQMLARVLKHEGGFSDHPEDRGGATNKGITQRVYNAWREERQLIPRSVKYIEPHEVSSIYYFNYFVAAKCDLLPSALAFQVFDGAVNSGVSRSMKWLQAVVGVEQDGKMGPKTLAAVLASDPEKTIASYLDRRLAFMKGLPTWKTFGRGWQRRIDENRAYAKEDLK